MRLASWLVLAFEKKEKGKHKPPIGIAAAAAVDTVIDGALISAGFSTGQHVGSLLAIALAIELFFLTSFSTATLFAGFLVLLAIKLLTRS